MSGRAWLLLAAALYAIPCLAERGVRVAPRQTPRAASFDPSQSAALFAGIRKFDDDDIEEVPYAADDAVDLAYAFALAPNTGLVEPRHVVLVLSGRPQKKVSQDRLAQLREAGALVETRATVANIFTLLKKQATEAGKDGLLIVSFATHGFAREDGEPRVLTSDSMPDFPEMTLSIARILDATSSSPARRSIVLFDACRERVTASRALAPDPRSAAPLVDALKHVTGQVVLFAAPHGGYTGDDPVRQNGVFTGAIVDAMQCGAASDERGFVTIATMRDYVNEQVLTWVRSRRDPDATSAIQVSFDGDTMRMPLASCPDGPSARPPPPPPPAEPVSSISIADTNVAAFSADGRELWRRDMHAPIVAAKPLGELAVVACPHAVHAIDGNGQKQWSVDLSADDMQIRDVLPRSLYRKATSELVVLCRNTTSSRVVVIDSQGKILGMYKGSLLLNDVEVDRMSARHATRIIAAADKSVVLFDARTVRPLWYGETDETIVRVVAMDFDNDGHRDIAVTTSGGATVHVDFDGRVLPSAGPHPRFELRAQPPASDRPQS